MSVPPLRSDALRTATGCWRPLGSCSPSVASTSRWPTSHAMPGQQRNSLQPVPDARGPDRGGIPPTGWRRLPLLPRRPPRTTIPGGAFAGYLTAVLRAPSGRPRLQRRGDPRPSPFARRRTATPGTSPNLITQLLDRARRAGVLRDDITVEDLRFVICGIAGTVEMNAGLAPRLWRRHLALLLDGFRPQAAHPLPEPPLAPGLPDTASSEDICFGQPDRRTRRHAG